MRRIKNSANSMLLLAGGLVIMTALLGLMLADSKALADDSAVTTTTITVPIACTMTSAGTNSHTATLSPNTYSGASGSTYENGIGKTTLTAICNDDNGFSIYAIGFTGNSYDSENHTKLVGSNTGGTISTKAYASGDTTSNWSMKLTKVTDSTESYNPQNLTILTGYDAWIAVPASFTKVAQYKANTGSSTTDTTLGVKLETTYAAYIASNQPADTYVGQVKYTMVHPYDEQLAQPQTSASGKICYYANASNAIGTMGCQSVASSVTLLASNFSRTGYGFAGWSDKFDYATNNEAHFYGPQEDLSIPDTSIYTGEGKGLSLYAVWVKSAGNLQDTSKVATLCGTGTGSLTAAPTDGTANLSSVSALTDQRDNNTYAIAKLADGKCWMIENLRLESTNSDNSTGALAQGYGTSTTYGNFSGLATAESTGFTTTYSANSLYSNDGSNNTINIGTSNSPAYRMPRYNNWNNQSTSANRPQDPTTNSATNSTTNASMYSYGNYYTWHAAIADLTYNGTNNSSVTNTSLCPAGWHLPKGGNKSNEANNDFWSLVVTGINEGTNPANYESSTQPYYTGSPEGSDASKAIRAYPNNFLYSGYFETSSAYSRGSNGYSWSSTTLSNYGSYYLDLNGSNVNPGTYNINKNNGYSIRCTVSAGT